VSYVAKVSLPGFDVGTATPEQCSIHSDYPPPKAKLGQSPGHVALLDVDFTGVVTQGVTHTLYFVNHTYSYIPFSFASIDFIADDGTPVVGMGTAGVGATLIIKAEATASVFRVTLFDNFNWTGSNARLLVSFYIFAEDGV
jgi:hypothetical protein